MYTHPTPLARLREAVLYERHATDAALEARPSDPTLHGMSEAYDTVLDLIDREINQP